MVLKGGIYEVQADPRPALAARLAKRHVEVDWRKFTEAQLREQLRVLGEGGVPVGYDPLGMSLRLKVKPENSRLQTVSLIVRNGTVEDKTGEVLVTFRNRWGDPVYTIAQPFDSLDAKGSQTFTLRVRREYLEATKSFTFEFR
jgi:hypothetical protein